MNSYKKSKEHFTEKNWRTKKLKGKKWREANLLSQISKEKVEDVNEEEEKIEKKNKDEKKRKKTNSNVVTEPNEANVLLVDKETKTGRSYTISLALPGSIVENAQSQELRTYLAGQIARAAAIFEMDEIVVFDENAQMSRKDFEAAISTCNAGGSHSYNCNVHLATILQYLECPQYLRKQLFPIRNELQYAGLLNPLDCLHHFRSDDLSVEYREGITLNIPTKNGRGTFCDVGLSKQVLVDQEVQPNVRVTLKLSTFDLTKKNLKGVVVSPSAPVIDGGLYWGYTVRQARSIGAVLDECPFEGGYDLKIGTSEKGANVDDLQQIPAFKHLLIVFGGVKGLESCVDNDQTISASDPSELFDLYLNTCPQQGSRTIRTEEAILISLSALRPKIKRSTEER